MNKKAFAAIFILAFIAFENITFASSWFISKFEDTEVNQTPKVNEQSKTPLLEEVESELASQLPSQNEMSSQSDVLLINKTSEEDLFIESKKNDYTANDLALNNQLTRAQLVKEIIVEFNLLERKKDYLDNCLAQIEFCLFNFSTQSDYDEMKIDDSPILYPDVSPQHEYYEWINAATMLGFVNGYITEENSPFHPENGVTRIQALKMVLSANELVENKYLFELLENFKSMEALLAQETVFEDIKELNMATFWYPRYVNFALENNIIEATPLFRPHDLLTREEFEDLIERSKFFLNQ